MNLLVPVRVMSVILGVCFLYVLAGCSAEYAPGAKFDSTMSMEKSEGFAAEASGSEYDSSADRNTSRMPTFQATEGSKSKSSNRSRKIIQTGRVELIVSDFDETVAEIESVVAQFDGIISSNNVNSRQNERRIGTWVIRVPTEEFDALYQQMQDIGVPVDSNRSGQDVTAEFVDLEARLKSKKALEQRVLQLLERPDDKIQHVIEVERELSRIRTDIEVMEGRMRFLVDQVSLSTLTLTVTEQRDYQPPQAPTLTNRLGTSWTGSLESLQQFGESSLILLVGMTPWIVVLGVLLCIAIVIFRIVRMTRRRRSEA